MGALSGLKPAPDLKYFEEICGIPHTSHHEKELSDYCVRFAKERGYECTQDEMGNVLIIAEAAPGYEDATAQHWAGTTGLRLPTRWRFWMQKTAASRIPGWKWFSRYVKRSGFSAPPPWTSLPAGRAVC